MLAIFLSVALGLGTASISLAQSVANTPSNTLATSTLASKLVFVAEGDPTCSVQYFDVPNGRTVKLITPESCPEKIVALHDRASILLITDYTLQEIPLAGASAAKSPLRLPMPKVKQGNSPGKPIGAGYQPDGLLSVALESVAPADDSEMYLYVYEQGAWVLKEERHCGRFDSCGFASIWRRPGRAYFWGEELRIWHDKQKGNPYITGGTSKTEWQGEDSVTTTALTFDFSGRQSVLSYWTIPGPDTGATGTMGVQLRVQGREQQTLVSEQCETSLMGKYLVLYRFWGSGTELIDLESGRSVLGRLKIAEWMYY